MRLAPAVLVLVAPVLAACANSGANYRPVIDGPAGPRLESDLAQCQALAASQPKADGRTAGAAATGAGLGAASSVIWNDNSHNLGRGAAVGAVAGLTSSAVRKSAQRESIVKNCMRNRGHNVVG